MIEEMKIKKTYYSAIALALVSCSTMDEMLPEGMFMTSQQVNDVVTAIPDRAEADLAGIYSFAGQAHSTFTTNGSIHNDFGYPSVCMFQDCNGPDMVCDNSNYNWMSVSHNYTDRNDDYIVCYIRYSYFYNQIALCNSVLSDMSGINLDEASSELRHNAGQALAVRAFDYLGLAPYYSFRYQDNPDALSVNLMTEDTKDYYNNPRVTLREVYELIISDLDRAIDYLSDYNRGGDKSRVDQNVAYGLRARAYLNMGMYAEAAEDAAKAMEGYTPYSMTEVGTPAFCNINDHNWMWGIMLESDNVAGLASWPAHLASFTATGYTTATGMYKRINKLLYDKIPATDVRKGWWVNESLDSPLLSTIEWNGRTGKAIASMTIPDIKLPFKEYTTVKFGQKQGIGSTDNASDWCIMRVEEMILLRAEGLADYVDIFTEDSVFNADQSRTYLESALAQGFKLRVHADEIAAVGGSVLAGRMKAASAEHLIVIDDAGLAALAEGGVTAACLPATSFYLGAAFAPVRRMIDEFAIPVAVATDFNPGSCPSLNLQFVMNLGYLKYRMTPEEILTAVTINPACAIGMGDRAGTIETGKQADLVIWNAKDVETLCYRFGSNQARIVIKKGEIVKCN